MFVFVLPLRAWDVLDPSKLDPSKLFMVYLKSVVIDYCPFLSQNMMNHGCLH